jgi:hypothetical protein
MTLRTVVSPGHALPETLTIEQFAPDTYHVVEALNGVAISEVWRAAGVTTARLGGKPLPANASAAGSSPAAKLADGPSLRRDTATRVGAETLDGRAATHDRDTAASFVAVLGHAESMPPSISADAPVGTLDFWVDDATGMLLKAEGTFNATSPSGRTTTMLFSAALTAIGTTAQVVPPSE